MDVREKLVELLLDMPFGNSTEEVEERHASDTAEYLIANGVTVQEWISVKDKYPNHGDVVLICTKDQDVQVFQWDEVYGGWVGDRYNYSTKYVTHWQYLPQPPKGEQ